MILNFKLFRLLRITRKNILFDSDKNLFWYTFQTIALSRSLSRNRIINWFHKIKNFKLPLDSINYWTYSYSILFYQTSRHIQNWRFFHSFRFCSMKINNDKKNLKLQWYPLHLLSSVTFLKFSRSTLSISDWIWIHNQFRSAQCVSLLI